MKLTKAISIDKSELKELKQRSIYADKIQVEAFSSSPEHIEFTYQENIECIRYSTKAEILAMCKAVKAKAKATAFEDHDLISISIVLDGDAGTVIEEYYITRK